MRYAFEKICIYLRLFMNNSFVRSFGNALDKLTEKILIFIHRPYLGERDYQENEGIEKLEEIYGFYQDARYDMRFWRRIAIVCFLTLISTIVYHI
jgi:hypothetical protein